MLLASCTNKNDYAIFSGEIKNTEITEFYMVSLSDTIKVVVTDGRFSDTIRSIGKYHFIDFGDFELTTFFEAGDEIAMTMRADAGLEGITFEGKGSDRLAYLVFKTKELAGDLIDPQTLYSQKESEFKKSLDVIFDGIRKEFENTKVSGNFRKTEAKSIDYLYFNLLRAYPSYHPYITNNREYKMSADFFPKEYTNLDMYNTADYDMYREYSELVTSAEMEKFYKSIEKNYPNLDASDLKFLDEIKIEKLKNKMVEQAAFFLSTANKDMQGFYDKLVSSSSDEAYKVELETRYSQLKKLLPGMSSADFRYEDINGDFVSLKDLKGKFVYIDVWATWCGPCKNEIPALKQLQQDFKNDDIVFVSISVDQEKDKATWKKMVADEGLAGIQLFADNSFRSFFIREYAIESIPRFILLDKQGNIVNADAPRPSGVGTKLYLEGILKGKMS